MSGRWYRGIFWLALGVPSLAGVAIAGQEAPDASADGELAAIRRLIEAPESQPDLAEAKLAIDLLVDPSINIVQTLSEIDGWAGKIRARLPAGANVAAAVETMFSTLYRPGPWNGQRPFRYDLENPLGTDIQAKLLPTYLRTRKGNCVSMPVLFAILAQRIGLNATLATAPEHLLVKVVDDNGQWVNVEATAGGYRYDSSYERELGISLKAIDNGLYLRPLAPREAVGAMLGVLMEHYRTLGRHGDQVAVADLALSVNSNDVVAMQHKGAAYYLLLQQRYVSRYPTPAHIPSDQRADYEWLSRENLNWYAKAEALGWVEPTPAQRAAYLQTIQNELARTRTSP